MYIIYCILCCFLKIKTTFWLGETTLSEQPILRDSKGPARSPPLICKLTIQNHTSCIWPCTPEGKISLTYFSDRYQAIIIKTTPNYSNQPILNCFCTLPCLSLRNPNKGHGLNTPPQPPVFQLLTTWPCVCSASSLQDI